MNEANQQKTKGMEEPENTLNRYRFIRESVRIAGANVATGKGGPFGAVIVRDGEVLAAAGNCVLQDNDPTAHAEIVAIREACRKQGSYFLEGAEIYCSCEPCPMCLGAIYWAHISTIYYCADRLDAANGGFDDSMIYEEIGKAPEDRKIPFIRLDSENGKSPFDAWINFTGRKPY